MEMRRLTDWPKREGFCDNKTDGSHSVRKISRQSQRNSTRNIPTTKSD